MVEKENSWWISVEGEEEPQEAVKEGEKKTEEKVGVIKGGEGDSGGGTKPKAEGKKRERKTKEKVSRKTQTGTATKPKEKYDFNINLVRKRERIAKKGGTQGFAFDISNVGNVEDTYQFEFNIFKVEDRQTKGKKDESLMSRMNQAQVEWKRGGSKKVWPRRDDTGPVGPGGSVIVTMGLDIPLDTADGRYMIELTAKSKASTRKKREDYCLLSITSN